MGSSVSTPFVGILNETMAIFGMGITGLGYFCLKTKSFFLAATCCGCLCYTLQLKEKLDVNENQVVFITGCDTGLGYSLAHHLCEKGCVVIAGFLNEESTGANDLKRKYPTKLIPVELDITKNAMIIHAEKVVRNYLTSHPSARLHAVINNAGVMIFGEFEWLTEQQVQQLVNINFIGTMQVSHTFLPLLRQNSARLIIVGSHCAAATLPGLAVYGATKAALHGWADALRVEMSKYGVHVIKFIPGSIVLNTSILSRLKEHKRQMFANFSPEQHEFYDDYFIRYFKFLSKIPVPSTVTKIEDDGLYLKFDGALLHKFPDAMYTYEPLNYKLYHVLFKVCPWWLRDQLILKFMALPEWKRKST